MGDAPIVTAELNRFRGNSSGRVSPAWGTAHIRKALVELGDPQEHMPPAVHLTGTNGKGSTGAFIRAMAEAAGLKVHVFTSPHLLRVNERIRVASRLVEDDALADVLSDIARRTEGLTYFEALTAAAFCLFAQERADLTIVEVGAGGETDATNVMTHPKACVVTPISRDHEAMFGVSGVAAIARLKAGIFREGTPVVIAKQPAIPLGVLREQARLVGAPVLNAGEEWTARWDGDAFVYQGQRVRVRAPWLGLPGAHQAQNAGAACAAIEVLGDKRITAEAMSVGLREATWPGRLQQLKRGPLAGDMDSNASVWVDAAHNPGGAAVLARAITRAKGEGERVAVVIAMQGVKDIAAVIAQLKDAVDVFVTCPLPDSGGQEGGAGANPREVARVVESLGARAVVADGLMEAVRVARGVSERVYIAGSVYLCGAALALNGEQVE